MAILQLKSSKLVQVLVLKTKFQRQSDAMNTASIGSNRIDSVSVVAAHVNNGNRDTKYFDIFRSDRLKGASDRYYDTA